MADPLIPGALLVQAIFQGVSELPRDRFVNTFHFASDASFDVAGPEAIQSVNQFYTTSGGAAGTLASLMASSAVNEATSEIRAYDLSVPLPREPIIEPFTGLTMGSGQALPSEVAMCISYYAQVNQPRSRGRIYIGPLLASNSTTSGPTRVKPEICLELAYHAKTLIVTGGDSPVWCVKSMNTVTGALELKPITDGWVDDAYDTLRGRGEDANSRVIYDVATP